MNIATVFWLVLFANLVGSVIGFLLFEYIHHAFIRHWQRRAFRDSHSPYGINDGRHSVQMRREFNRKADNVGRDGWVR